MNYWIYTDVPEEVERFETLRTDKIKVYKIKPMLWKVMFNFHCKHLASDGKLDGRWYCTIYNEKRPTYCPEYPRNFMTGKEPKEVLDWERAFCPLLDVLLRQSIKNRK